MCTRCWRAQNGARKPVRIRGMYTQREDCCWCGKPTLDGIYVREDPALAPAHASR